MNENDQENEKSEEKEEIKTEQPADEEAEPEKSKAKFTFKCTRCDKCCLTRGPIPVTLWDLEMWARNGVVANFLPYLDVYSKPDGVFDLILKPLPPQKQESEKSPAAALTGTPIEELLEEKCPLYNADQKKCLIYENRPLECCLLKCWDTSELISVIGKNTIKRADIINPDDPILLIIDNHEIECSYHTTEGLIDALSREKEKSNRQ